MEVSLWVEGFVRKFLPTSCQPTGPTGAESGGPKGGHLKEGHLKMFFFVSLKFALDMSILTALSKAIPQGKRRLDREGTV